MDFKERAKKFLASCISEKRGGKIEIHIDKLYRTVIGTFDIKGTGEWFSYETFETEITGSEEVHDEFFKFV